MTWHMVVAHSHMPKAVNMKGIGKKIYAMGMVQRPYQTGKVSQDVAVGVSVSACPVTPCGALVGAEPKCNWVWVDEDDSWSLGYIRYTLCASVNG